MEYFRSEMIPDPLPLPTDETGWRQMVVDVLETLIISIVLFLAINTVSARIRVESVSMKGTLDPGNFVLVNRLAYKWDEVGRGDIVVFDPPFDSPEPFVKRVIGLPGETVSIENGKIYVNDVLLPEPYLKVDFYTTGQWTVPSDAIFVMGDNRNNSSDSRSWGTVPVENIIGKALFVYWPVTQWGGLGTGAYAAENP